MSPQPTQIDAEIRGYFEAEARELIDRLTSGVASLQAGSEDPAVLQDLLRAAHTLKGAAHVVGERELATQAHAFEDAVADYKGAPAKPAADALMPLVDALAGSLTAPPPPAAVADPQQTQPQPEAKTPGLRTVRIDVEKAVVLLDGVGESGVLVAAMRGVLAQLDELEGTGTSEMRRVARTELRRNLKEQLDRLERQMRALQTAASQLRLAAAETLLLEAGRIVRVTAAAVGKQAVAVTRGGRERIDVRILDALGDALLHLIRNAVAHGVETPAERKSTSKPPVATITITVEHTGRDVQVRCIDDGRGIALEPLRQRAIELGLMPPTQAAQAEAAHLLPMLLHPNFNGGGPIDEVSGRGVGLDAVREAVRGVGGTISIDTKPGEGTTFTISVPQTRSVVDTMEVEAGGRRYALPLAAIEQTFRLDTHLTIQAQSTRSLLVGQEMMSFLQLQHAFPAHTPLGDRSAQTLTSSMTGVVLNINGQRLALGVDRVTGIGESLIQPLPLFAFAEPHVAGASLGSDGTPTLILDPSGLMALALGERLSTAQSAPAPSLIRRPILVVDDSLTTRMLEQSILEAEGYEVELATSAEQGLQMAHAKPYALFLVDVEMPGMNGYDFVRTVRGDARFDATPAILVTSLDSAESRERGRTAGAASYIVKGEFNQQIYLDRIRALVGNGA